MVIGTLGCAVAKKRAIDIELVTDRQVYLPGEAVTAFVRLVPGEDLEAVECSVALVHIDRYPVGDGSSTDDRAVAGEYVLNEDDLSAGVAREFTVVLPVPRRIVPPETPEDCADERFPPSGDEADPESYDLWIEPEERWGPPTSVGPGGRRCGWCAARSRAVHPIPWRHRWSCSPRRFGCLRSRRCDKAVVRRSARSRSTGSRVPAWRPARHCVRRCG
ncbi:hypothetical protein GCM10010464_74710 [Pseudonocardia yunnanensis]